MQHIFLTTNFTNYTNSWSSESQCRDAACRVSESRYDYTQEYISFLNFGMAKRGKNEERAGRLLPGETFHRTRRNVSMFVVKRFVTRQMGLIPGEKR